MRKIFKKFYIICYSVSIRLSVFVIYLITELLFSLLLVELACLSLHFSKSDFYDAVTVALYERYSCECIDRFLMSSWEWIKKMSYLVTNYILWLMVQERLAGKLGRFPRGLGRTCHSKKKATLSFYTLPFSFVFSIFYMFSSIYFFCNFIKIKFRIVYIELHVIYNCNN
jgi:hypothetical protein